MTMRLIDADGFATEMRERKDKALKWLVEGKDYETVTRADAVLSFLCEVKLTLDKMPTVDAVPVVRCRDCKWWKTNYFWNGTEHKVCVIEPYEPCRNPNDYCSRGERKDGADDDKT